MLLRRALLRLTGIGQISLALWRNAAPWLRRSLAVAGSLLFAVPLLTNLALWLRVIPRLLNADSAAISYRSAWAPWPTRVRIHDLLVTGQDRNIQFAVRVEEAWLTVELWAAVSERTLKITKLRGSGVSVRALQRLQPWAVDDAKVRALPDIPGRTKPPLTEAFVPAPPATREHYDQISIDASDIDATARELWIDEARYLGNVHVVGAFLFRPGLELHIGPGAAVDFRDGELSIAGRPALTRTQGRANAETPHFNPIEPEGVAILAFFSGALAVRATLVNAEFANYFLAPSGVEAHGGAGTLAVRFGLDRGLVRPGSTLDVSSRDLHVTGERTQLDASLLLRASIDGSSRGTLELTTEHLSLGPLDGRARLEGGELAAKLATSGPVDLAKPVPAMRYSAVVSALSGDVAAVRPYLPRSFPLTLDQGHLTVGGEVSGTGGKPDLRAALQLKSELTAHVEDRRFAGKLSAHGKLTETPERVELTGTTLALSDLMVAKGKDVTYGWWTQVEVVSGGAVKGSSPRLELALTGGLRDIEPLYVAFGKDIGIPAWVQGLLPLPNTTWRGHLAADAGAVRVSEFRATSGTVEVLLKLEKPAEKDASGAVKLASGPLSFGVAFASGRTKSQLFATDAWFDRQK